MQTHKHTGYTGMPSRTHLNTALVQSELHLKPSALKTEQGRSQNASCCPCSSPPPEVEGGSTSAGPRREGRQGAPPKPVPEHLSDIADAQVDNLERVVSGTAKQMQLVMAEVQGGHPALYGDYLDTAGSPEGVGMEMGEEKTSQGTSDRLCVCTFPAHSRGTPGL